MCTCIELTIGPFTPECDAGVACEPSGFDDFSPVEEPF